MGQIIAFRPPQVQPRPVNPSAQAGEIVDTVTRRKRKQLARQQPESETATAKNGRLRKQRWRAWHAASARVGYYEAALAMVRAIAIAQTADIAEGLQHKPVDHSVYSRMLADCRQAEKAKFLTPASRIQDVEWKRRILASAQFKYLELPPHRAQQIIDDDLEFLASHPFRKSK